MNKSNPIAIKPEPAREGYRAANAPEGLAASGKALGEVACLSPDAALQRLSSIAGGLTPDQVKNRLQTSGLNQVAHQAHHTIFGELVGRSINPLNLRSCRVGDRVLFPRRSAGGDRDRGHGRLEHLAGLHSGASLQQCRRRAAADGVDHRHRPPAGGGDAHDHIDVPIDQLVPGRHCLAVGGRHDPRRFQADLGQGSLRQPVGADRRGDAARKGR